MNRTFFEAEMRVSHGRAVLCPFVGDHVYNEPAPSRCQDSADFPCDRLDLCNVMEHQGRYRHVTTTRFNGEPVEARVVEFHILQPGHALAGDLQHTPLPVDAHD